MFKILFVLLFIVASYMASPSFIHQMAILQMGLPSFENCTVYQTTSFIKCTLMCSKTTSCYMNQLQNDSCLLCGIDARRSLKNDSYRELTGIKVSGWVNLTQMCISVRNNLTATTTSSSTTTKATTTTPRPKSCPNGWNMFLRGNISWCLKVALPRSYSRNNYTAAWETCQNQNSTLSGLNNVQEQAFVRDSAYQLLAKTINNMTFNPRIWVDGTRKPECSSSNWTSIPSCAGIKAFQFTDPTLITPAGYQWYTNEPNGDISQGVIQSCIQMIITANKTNAAYGKMDDISCNYATPLLMALCGQLAT